MKRYLSSTAVVAWLSLLCVAVAIASTLAGCGSASQTVSAAAGTRATGKTGSAVFTIKWPARTASTGRLIPADSNSIIVTLTLNGATLGTQIASRPASGGTTTLTFPTLPVGQVGVTAIAVPDTTVNPNDPTVHGTPQASGTGILNIVNGQTATLSVTMASTITSVEILPDGLYMLIGSTAPVTFEAFDSAGDMVLVSPSTVQWSITNTAFATVTPDTGDTGAVVTGVASGDTHLTVTETESHQSYTILVSVRGPLASVHITTIDPAMDVQGVAEFGFVGKDAAGNIIHQAGLQPPTWSSSAPSIASISTSINPNFPDLGECIANSVGPAQGAVTAQCTISIALEGFTDSTTLTVNAGPGGPPILSPTLVDLELLQSQYFSSETDSPTGGATTPTNVSYSIVYPTGANVATFGSIVQGNGYCVYTAPSALPTVTNSSGTSTVTQVKIAGSDGSSSTVTLITN